MQGQPCGQPGPTSGGDLIDAGGVDQLDRVEPFDRDWPEFHLLAPGAAMGHVGGTSFLAQQCIEQA